MDRQHLVDNLGSEDCEVMKNMCLMSVCDYSVCIAVHRSTYYLCDIQENYLVQPRFLLHVGIFCKVPALFIISL
ncbi:hypothetical protein Hanom_Chr13g01225511 [Helianthus anomalus]